MVDVGRRALFVCNEGHIFRSLVKMKHGRIRQCPNCAGVVTTGPRKNIASARRAVKALDGVDPAMAERQIFAKGRIRTVRRTIDEHSPNLFEGSN